MYVLLNVKEEKKSYLIKNNLFQFILKNVIDRRVFILNGNK